MGKDIEEFVHSRKVGADAWRRTVVMTFHGNCRTGPKVTYKRIQQHLENNTAVNYATIVQMCVARNKHRLSARRYKGMARITCRRARKGVSVKMSPDAYWSNTVYQDLDHLQFKNDRNQIIFNRDDAAGFRLDTTYTHKHIKVSN